MTKKNIVIGSTFAVVTLGLGIWAFLERRIIRDALEDFACDLLLRRFQPKEQGG